MTGATGYREVTFPLLKKYTIS